MGGGGTFAALADFPVFPALRATRRRGYGSRAVGNHHFILMAAVDGHFQARMEERRKEGQEPEAWAAFRRGWRLGAEDFAQRLSERLGRRGQKHEQARERKETDEQLAGRLIKEWLSAHGWNEEELKKRPKGDAGKAELARLFGCGAGKRRCHDNGSRSGCTSAAPVTCRTL